MIAVAASDVKVCHKHGTLLRQVGSYPDGSSKYNCQRCLNEQIQAGRSPFYAEGIGHTKAAQMARQVVDQLARRADEVGLALPCGLEKYEADFMAMLMFKAVSWIALDYLQADRVIKRVKFTLDDDGDLRLPLEDLLIQESPGELRVIVTWRQPGRDKLRASGFSGWDADYDKDATGLQQLHPGIAAVKAVQGKGKVVKVNSDRSDPRNNYALVACQIYDGLVFVSSEEQNRCHLLVGDQITFDVVAHERGYRAINVGVIARAAVRQKGPRSGGPRYGIRYASQRSPSW